MTELIQTLVNGFALGGSYALLALGLAMVFSVFGLINFAHGEIIAFAGYIMFWSTANGLSFLVSVPLAILGGGLMAIAMERIAFRPLRGASVEALIVSSFAVSIILQIVFQDFIGARAKSVPIPSFLDEAVSVFGLTIGVVQLVSIFASALALVATTAYLTRTRSGLSMRAAASDFAATRLMGVPADRVLALAFFLSGILAGISAIFIVSQQGSVNPTIGAAPVLAAFVATILGGLGNLKGAVIGGLVLGIIETVLRTYLSIGIETYSRAILYAVVILVLMVRPHGLVGDRVSASAKV